MSESSAGCHYRDMTVAHIREPSDADYAHVAFLESARFYRLSKRRPKYTAILGLLRDAQSTGRALSIGCESLDSDLIEDVRERNADKGR
jgi:hypothetical protein